MSNIINDKVKTYIDGLYRPLNRPLEELRIEAEAEHIPIILRDTEMLLLNLLRMRGPAVKRILEVGTAIGYSACCMGAVLPQAQIVTIEADKAMARRARGNIEKMGMAAQIEVIEGQGQEQIPRLTGSFDFVFIDAAKSHYRIFWDQTVPLCAPGAVILCDNVLLKAMTAADEYDEKRKYKTSIKRMREFLAYLTGEEQGADAAGTAGAVSTGAVGAVSADTAVLPVGDGVALSVLKG